MITIFHNPRCSKSRQGLELVKRSGEECEIREYLKNPFTEQELQSLLETLSMTPIELVRTDEKVWKEHYKGKDLNDSELIRVMIQHPSLIQRPIVLKGQRAVVGRPTEKISELLE